MAPRPITKPRCHNCRRRKIKACPTKHHPASECKWLTFLLFSATMGVLNVASASAPTLHATATIVTSSSFPTTAKPTALLPPLPRAKRAPLASRNPPKPLPHRAPALLAAPDTAPPQTPPHSPPSSSTTLQYHHQFARLSQHRRVSFSPASICSTWAISGPSSSLWIRPSTQSTQQLWPPLHVPNRMPALHHNLPLCIARHYLSCANSVRRRRFAMIAGTALLLPLSCCN